MRGESLQSHLALDIPIFHISTSDGTIFDGVGDDTSVLPVSMFPSEALSNAREAKDGIRDDSKEGGAGPGEHDPGTVRSIAVATPSSRAFSSSCAQAGVVSNHNSPPPSPSRPCDVGATARTFTLLHQSDRPLRDSGYSMNQSTSTEIPLQIHSEVLNQEDILRPYPSSFMGTATDTLGSESSVTWTEPSFDGLPSTPSPAGSRPAGPPGGAAAVGKGGNRTGRWTLDEKLLFLYGLRQFGKGRWKKMKVYLPDR
jgi:hypothetical protein